MLLAEDEYDFYFYRLTAADCAGYFQLTRFLSCIFDMNPATWIDTVASLSVVPCRSLTPSNRASESRYQPAAGHFSRICADQVILITAHAHACAHTAS